MKRIAVLLSAILIIASCCPNSKKAVSEYLQNEIPNVEITVNEVGEIEDIYSPFDALNALDIVAAQAGYVTRDLPEDFFSDLSEINFALSHLDSYSKANPEKANRKGFPASVAIDGFPTEIYVFLNRDGKTIGHTTLELKDQLSTLIKKTAPTIGFDYGF